MVRVTSRQKGVVGERRRERESMCARVCVRERERESVCNRESGRDSARERSRGREMLSRSRSAVWYLASCRPEML